MTDTQQPGHAATTTPATTPATSSDARKTWKTLEPVHAMIYFAPEAQEEYAAIGLDLKANRALGYVPARAAAMGAVGPGIVHATFFSFSRLACEFGLAGAWDAVSPAEVLAARYRGADRALRRMCGDALDGPDVAEAVTLCRTACEGASDEGRPLYAAHADLPWPEAPHLQLFHAIMLLREFRGDGHIAALVTEGVSGIEAAVMAVSMGDSWSRRAMQKTRVYSDDEWETAVHGLVARGWLAPGAGEGDVLVTDEGSAHRQNIEDLTDTLALPTWARIGVEGCTRARELVRPLSQAITDSGGVGVK